MFIAEQLERTADSNAVTRNEGVEFVLSSELKRVMKSTGYQSLGGVEIIVHYGVVFLRGYVPSFHMKQVAQTAARSVSGVREVRNELIVVGSR